MKPTIFDKKNNEGVDLNTKSFQYDTRDNPNRMFIKYSNYENFYNLNVNKSKQKIKLIKNPGREHYIKQRNRDLGKVDLSLTLNKKYCSKTHQWSDKYDDCSIVMQESVNISYKNEFDGWNDRKKKDCLDIVIDKGEEFTVGVDDKKWNEKGVNEMWCQTDNYIKEENELDYVESEENEGIRENNNKNNKLRTHLKRIVRHNSEESNNDNNKNNYNKETNKNMTENEISKLKPQLMKSQKNENNKEFDYNSFWNNSQDRDTREHSLHNNNETWKNNEISKKRNKDFNKSNANIVSNSWLNTPSNEEEPIKDVSGNNKFRSNVKGNQRQSINIKNKEFSSLVKHKEKWICKTSTSSPIKLNCYKHQKLHITNEPWAHIIQGENKFDSLFGLKSNENMKRKNKYQSSWNSEREDGNNHSIKQTPMLIRVNPIEELKHNKSSTNIKNNTITSKLLNKWKENISKNNKYEFDDNNDNTNKGIVNINKLKTQFKKYCFTQDIPNNWSTSTLFTLQETGEGNYTTNYNYNKKNYNWYIVDSLIYPKNDITETAFEISKNGLL